MHNADEGGEGGGGRPVPRRPWRTAALLGFGLAVIVGLVLRTFIAGAVHVRSQSMEETVLPGDFVLVNRLVAPRRVLLQIPFTPLAPRVVSLPPIRRIRLGDVLVVHPPPGVAGGNLPANAYLLKRCVGTPGDTLLFRGSTLSVNGLPLSFPPAARQSRSPIPFTAPDAPVTRVIPQGTYFLLGDNPSGSEDSRVWGPVPYTSIVGSASIVYWSLAPAPGTGGTESGGTRVRWHRLGTLVR